MSKSDKASSDDLEPSLDPVPSSEEGEVDDAVFGQITEKGPNYRNVGWMGSAALMMKLQIGLGVLSIPSVFDTLGMVPGVIVLCIIAAITTWSDYMIGVFKLRHRQVYGIDDVGGLLFGRVGKEVFAIMYWLYYVFVAGSAMLSVSIAFNALSSHGACTAIFVAVAAVIGFAFASIRTLGRISWLAWIGVICILTAVMTVTIAVGVEDRPSAAPKDGPWKSDFKIVGSPTFAQAISGVSSLVFAYAGTPGFFPVVAEMRDPRLYPRALIVCQTTVTLVYIVVGVVVYYYCGSYVATPALGSAGPTIKKVAYGIALPGLLVTMLLDIHLGSKIVFIRILRGSRHLTANTPIHWVTWLGCTSGMALISYLIASGIPVFGGLVALVGALLATTLTFQPMGCMWLYDNWGRFKKERSLQLTWMVAFSTFVIVAGWFLTVAGTYGAIVGIINGKKSTAWSCADNSNSS